MPFASAVFAPHVPDNPAGWSPEIAGFPTASRQPTPDETRDHGLVARIQAGDIDALHAVYVEHYQVLCDVARSIVRNADATEDVVQQVFLELWQRRSAWHPLRLRPALIRAVRYRALDYWRRERKHESLDAIRSFSTSEAAQADTDHRELSRLLADALAALPERRRTALLLRAVQRLSYAEIGAALDITEKAAYILVARTRLSLEPLRRRFQGE